MMGLFDGIFDNGTAILITPSKFVLCVLVSLFIGLALSVIYNLSSKSSKSFCTTIAILPAIVCVVIMMVNGNVGAGVAVAGAFSLVRFRSAQGTAKEISMIFLAMGAGLICGMGYLGYAVLFSVIIAAMFCILSGFIFTDKVNDEVKDLRITIPEDMNYTDVFTDVFAKYTDKVELISVKTSNMGSLFKLRYNVILKDKSLEKEFLDEIRTKNGNLEISMSRQETSDIATL